MAHVRTLRKGKRRYYVLEHKYRLKGQVKNLQLYLGKDIPKNIERLKEQIEIRGMDIQWNPQFSLIKKSYQKELASLPDVEIKRRMQQFMVEFIYHSDRIEGSSLTMKDTVDVLIHHISPPNKKLKDVQETQGYAEAFEDMIKTKKDVSKELLCAWHRMLFKVADPIIAGRFRKHKIMVTGSRATFPWPEELENEFRKFQQWYDANKKKMNPIVLSGMVHLKFVSVHPFSDGNGRISRLVANYILHKHGYPPFLLNVTKRRLYYNALEKSNLYSQDKHFLRFFVKLYLRQHNQYKTIDAKKS